MANVLYERVGAASLLTIDRPERRNAIDGQTAEELLAGYRSFESDENAYVLVVTGSGEKAFSAGADLKAIETLAPRVNSERGSPGIHASGLAQAHHRCDLRLVRGRWAGARLMVRFADRDRGRAVRVSGSQVGRANPGWRDHAPGGHRRGFQSA